jgi:hypothetical protein
MMLLNIVAIFSTVLFSSAFADTNSSTTSTSSAPVATHTVAVGADGFNYYPNQITANVHDIIEYQFFPLNHSVVRAAFGPTPCIPYEWTGPGRVGFYSGFQPVNSVLPNPPTFRIEVNDTEPIFYYCSAPGACFQGMIGVINPNSTFTFADQFAYTQNTTEEFSPGQSFLPETLPPVRTTTYTGATAAPTATSTTASSTAAPVASKSAPFPIGAIVGIAIGAFALVVLAASLIYICGRQKTVKEILRQSQFLPSNHNSYQPGPGGIYEAQYPNLQKASPVTISTDEHFSPQNYPTHPAERSTSPDERTGMINMQQMQAPQQGYPSPGLMSPGSPGYYPSPAYSDRHEMGNAQTFAGVR